MNAEIGVETRRAFDWPLAYEAETVLRRLIGSFLARNQVASKLAKRMEAETGTDFYEWVDQLSAGPDAVEAVQSAGVVLEQVDTPPGAKAFYHPRAMMPRVLVHRNGSLDGAPRELAIGPESIIGF